MDKRSLYKQKTFQGAFLLLAGVILEYYSISNPLKEVGVTWGGFGVVDRVTKSRLLNK